MGATAGHGSAGASCLCILTSSLIFPVVRRSQSRSVGCRFCRRCVGDVVSSRLSSYLFGRAPPPPPVDNYLRKQSFTKRRRRRRRRRPCCMAERCSRSHDSRLCVCVCVSVYDTNYRHHQHFQTSRIIIIIIVVVVILY